MDREHSWPGRWGTETQGTHCREGEAGHNELAGRKDGRDFVPKNRVNVEPVECVRGSIVVC